MERVCSSLSDGAVRRVAAADRLDTLPEGVPELTLGWEALAWCARYLRHPDGAREGERWQFTPRQARFVLWWYAVDEDGNWLFGHGARRLSKGSGKSPWAAVMSLVELLAPVRFDRFVEGVPGGCVGRPVSMPLVQVAAASASQTANTMSYVRALVASSPALLAEYDLDVGKEKIYSKPAGELTIITSSAHSAEGARATCVIADELEHWLPSNGGTALHSTLKANLTKTGSRMIETLNSWIPDVGSAGEATFKAWCDIEDGRARDVDRGILYDAVQAPPGIDLADEESLRGALEFVYADCPWSLEHLDAIISYKYPK